VRPDLADKLGDDEAKPVGRRTVDAEAAPGRS